MRALSLNVYRCKLRLRDAPMGTSNRVFAVVIDFDQDVQIGNFFFDLSSLLGVPILRRSQLASTFLCLLLLSPNVSLSRRGRTCRSSCLSWVLLRDLRRRLLVLRRRLRRLGRSSCRRWCRVFPGGLRWRSPLGLCLISRYRRRAGRSRGTEAEV